MSKVKAEPSTPLKATPKKEIPHTPDPSPKIAEIDITKKKGAEITWSKTTRDELLELTTAKERECVELRAENEKLYQQVTEYRQTLFRIQMTLAELKL